jgi:hypothetical protein
MKSLFFSMILSIFAATAIAATLTSVSFTEPKDGATVGKTFRVVMNVTGMKIAKAGEDVKNRMAGHHHIIVDGGPIPPGQSIPQDATHLHFGKGQTWADITLPPGKHTLTLQFADGNHDSYGPAMSKTITVNVK